MTRVTEVAEQTEDDPEETDNDGECTGKVDTCDHVDGVSLLSADEGRQTDSGSMSSRSESKPYSSVTHKCEVRCFCLLVFLHQQPGPVLPFLLHHSFASCVGLSVVVVIVVSDYQY